jgi:hypothetical protein
MGYMFANCSDITNIQMPNDITTTKPAADMHRLFENCTDLTCIDKIDTTNATNTTDMFVNCSNLTAPDATDQTNIENGASWTNPNSCP